MALEIEEPTPDNYVYSCHKAALMNCCNWYISHYIQGYQLRITV